MISEQRRRAYLDAMQVDTWLPRSELPFAAPSSESVLAVVSAPPPVAVAEVPAPEAKPAPAPSKAERPPIQQIKAAAAPLANAVNQPVVEIEDEVPVAAAPASLPPPRFSLQLMRAGACLVLVELPTGEAFQSRDPAYILLKDLLRAAGLPDSPQLLGEPVRWPLLSRGNLDQGPQAARDFVQSFVAVQREKQPCESLWLVGLPAIRFAGDGDQDSYNRELQVEGLGHSWALPGLELLMEEPQRKRDLWQAMRRVRQRWLAREESMS